MMGATSAEPRVAHRAAGEPLRLRIARWAARTMRSRTVTASAHPPIVSFTFDDIPVSAAEQGSAILEEAGRRGTFYVAGGLVGTAQPQGFATAAHCLALHRAGHEIGCHTFAHRPVSELDRAGLAQDLDRNARFLEALDPGIAPTSFAYPFNHTSLRAKRQIERCFASCRGGVPGINAGRIDLGFLRAVTLSDELLDKGAARHWITRAVAERGWLIFFTHGVEDDHDPWGCRPNVLRSAVAEALDRGALVLPVREALQQVAGIPSPLTVGLA